MSWLIEEIFFIIVEVVFMWSGEVILFVITLGRRKPRWDLYIKENSITWSIQTGLSFAVGVIGWAFIVWGFIKLFA